MNPNLNPKAKP